MHTDDTRTVDRAPSGWSTVQYGRQVDCAIQGCATPCGDNGDVFPLAAVHGRGHVGERYDVVGHASIVVYRIITGWMRS